VADARQQRRDRVRRQRGIVGNEQAGPAVDRAVGEPNALQRCQTVERCQHRVARDNQRAADVLVRTEAIE
jgi:hypothetical protein